jgi:uncharacterized repeat protein (TIGR03837 family)
MRWTVFCRVVDNFGDVGFAWRLAADLGHRDVEVRLALDDPTALAWMAPRGAPRVEVVTWAAGAAASADVWVETFGCGLPDEDVATQPRICVNVEHLSAESYVERSHGRPSPRLGLDGEPRPLWFFYPGFSAYSGGLLREPGLLERRERFGDGRRWLRALGVERRDGERCVSLFCYRNAALAEWLEALDAMPTLLLLTPGPATEQCEALLGPGLQRRNLRAVRLPALAQADFDRLLWSTDLNLVRGEDSLVRALWAGAPFVWQLYPQDDGAHRAKLDAFLDRFLEGAPASPARLRLLFLSWNGFDAPGPLPAAFGGVDIALWKAHCLRFRERCVTRADLSSALLDFVASKG